VTDRIVVSGIGMIGPGSFGRTAVIQAFPAVPRAAGTGRVSEFALEEYLEGGRAFRRVSGATKFALAALGLAAGDAGFSVQTFGGSEAAIVVGITHGGAPYSVEFHRELMLDGPLAASPLYFSESVPNAPAGNAAIAFRVRGPVHTLIGDEPVGTEAIDLAAGLLRSGLVKRCLVAGTEEWSEVVTHAYAQIDHARRPGRASNDVPPLSEGAAALVLELESAVTERGGTAQAALAGWGIERCPEDRVMDRMAAVARAACAQAGCSVSAADHVVLPTGRCRRAAMRACIAARGEAAPPPVWVDVAQAIGNPAGASNLLQLAVSAALIAAGKVDGPGLILTTGTTGTLSAAVVSGAGRAAT
jgi:3-oxoacyl-[acyl-carrier-protein] synthase II